MTDHKPPLKSLLRPTPGWVNVLIAIAAGAIIGTVLALNI